MRPFIIHLLTLLAICLVLCTCRHEPNFDPNGPQCGEATTIDEMMDWVYFKTGTYWIYQEQNKGGLDTMTVYYDYNGVSATGNREFKIKMESSFDGYTYEYWFNDSWSNQCDTYFTDCFCRVVDCDKYVPGDYVGGNHTFIFPLIVGNLTGQQHGLDFGYSTITNHLNSVVLNSFTFSNVYEYQMEVSVQHNYEESTYKIAIQIGIIQKVIPGFSENWELIEYHIEQ